MEGIMNWRKTALYGVSAVVLAIFAPMLDFKWLAGGAIILVGLVLIDLVQAARKRRD